MRHHGWDVSSEIDTCENGSSDLHGSCLFWWCFWACFCLGLFCLCLGLFCFILFVCLLVSLVCLGLFGFVLFVWCVCFLFCLVCWPFVGWFGVFIRLGLLGLFGLLVCWFVLVLAVSFVLSGCNNSSVHDQFVSAAWTARPEHTCPNVNQKSSMVFVGFSRIKSAITSSLVHVMCLLFEFVFVGLVFKFPRAIYSCCLKCIRENKLISYLELKNA